MEASIAIPESAGGVCRVVAHLAGRPSDSMVSACGLSRPSGRPFAAVWLWAIPCSRFGSMINRFMRIIARRTLREFVVLRAGPKDQPALKTALDAWFDEVRKERWTGVADIKRLYRTASVVTAERVVFNIKGNDYRLVTAIDFEKGIVWIKWLGPHKEYDRIDVRRIKHGD